MLQRYLEQIMSDLWDESNKYSYWLQLELTVLLIRARKGEITRACYNFIKKHATFDVDEINRIDKDIRHDLLAFCQSVQNHLMAAGIKLGRSRQHMQRWIAEFHKKTTSYDTEDPATILILRASCQLIRVRLIELRETIVVLARKHKGTLMVASTHGVFAKPDTFGRLLLTFVEDFDKCIERLNWIERYELSQAKLSGAVGNYGGLNPAEEKAVLAELGLTPVGASTQIVQRDRHAMYLCTLAVVGGCLERMARVLWEMTRSESRQIQEPRSRNQKGSSAMPHKKNPIGLEQLQGIAILLRGYAGMSLETISTPDCRAISQSIVERHSFPDSTYILYYGLGRATAIIKDLVVFPARMKELLMVESCQLWASEDLKVALLENGVDSEVAYRYVQELSFEAWETRVTLSSLLDRLIGDTKLSAIKLLRKPRIKQIFDPWYSLTHEGGLQTIYQRFKI